MVKSIKAIKKGLYKGKIYGLIVVLLLSMYLPWLPTSIFTDIAKAATISPAASTVNTTTLLKVSPSIASTTDWYYNGLTAVKDAKTGSTLGSVYRYISKDGKSTRSMVKGSDAATWAKSLTEDPDYVYRQFENTATRYTFTPPASTKKSAFDRYLFSDLLDAAGITYTNSGDTLYITQSEAPKVKSFLIKESPTVNGCYPLYSNVTIQFTIAEYMVKSNTLRNVQVYGLYEGQSQPFEIGSIATATTTNGEYKGSFTYTLASNEKLTLYIRAYDGANRIDQDSKNGKTLGSFGKFGKNQSLCTALDVQQDVQPIAMYDYTNTTLLQAQSLLPSSSLGRQNGKMRNYPDGNIAWFGPVRYPTIYYGNSSDGGTKTTANTSLQAEGKSGKKTTLSAYQKPFMYILGPIDSAVAKPDSKIHNSIATQTFNIQEVSRFGRTDIQKMYNGNPDYVLEKTPKHTVTTKNGKNLGKYYWIRELAEYSGGDVSNNCTVNDTCLEIYQTSYPDITKFALNSTNDYSNPNQAIKFTFNGYEYVSNTRTGIERNKVDWNIEVLSGPSQVGEKVTGTLNSNKTASNSDKPSMTKYDGKFSSTASAKFTPTAEGDYTVRLTVTDAVQRSTKSNVVAFKIGSGGGETAPPPEPSPTDPPPEPSPTDPPPASPEPPTVTITGPSTVFLGEEFCLQADAITADPADTIDTYNWNYTGQGTTSGQAPCGLSYDSVGDKTLSVTVTDSNGLTATDDHMITVKAPTPIADFTVGGTLKENRAMTLTANHPYGGNSKMLTLAPLTVEQWTIEALDDANSNKICTVQDISSNLSYEQVVDWLVKNQGQYKITHHVKNSLGNEDTYSMTIDVQPDENPVADFNTVTLIYRDDVAPNGEYPSKAKIIIRDSSYSNDDVIGKRIYTITFDSDNDGDFTDETPEIISDANDSEITYITDKVGKYKIELEVWEDLAQPTIAQFVDLSFDKTKTVRHYHYTSTANPDKENAVKPFSEKVVEVDNLAPVVNLDAKESLKEVDVQYDTLNSPYSQAQLQSMTPYLNQLLSESGLKANMSGASENKGVKMSVAGSTVAFVKDGKLYVKGNFNGTTYSAFTLVNHTNLGLPNIPIKEIGLGVLRTAFLMEDGTVYVTSSPNNTISSVIKVKLPSKAVTIKTSFLTNGVLANLENGEIYIFSGRADPYTGTMDLISEESPIKVPSNNKVSEMNITGSLSSSIISYLNEQGELYLNKYPNSQLLQVSNVKTFGYIDTVSNVIDYYNSLVYVTKNNEVYVYGKNSHSRLGQGYNYDLRITTPTKLTLPSSIGNIEKIAMGQVHNIYLDDKGQAFAQGFYNSGSLGIGAYADTSVTAAKVAISQKIIDVVAGQESTWFVDENGKIYETGYFDDWNNKSYTPILQVAPVSAINHSSKFVKTEGNNPLYAISLTNQSTTSDEELKKINNLSAYYVGAGTATNKTALESVVTANNKQGTFIDIGNTYDNTNLKIFIGKLADYIIETQADTSIQLDVMIGENDSIDSATLESKIQSIMEPILKNKELTLNFVNVSKQSASTSYKDISMITKNNFLLSLKTDNYSSNLQKQFKAASLINNAYFVGMGSSSNKATIEDIANVAMKKGTYQAYNGLDSSLTALANYIADTVEKNLNVKEIYTTTDDEMQYFTTYNDYEKDIMLQDRWKFEHIPSYFENTNGTLNINNQYTQQPITKFSQVGRYQPFYSAKDDPLTPVFANTDFESFKDYRKWSKEADNWRIFVHRKPSSDFKFAIDKTNGAYSVTSLANDKDKASVDVGFGAGLQSQAFSWKLEDDSQWQDGLPSGNLKADVVYDIRNTAVDFQNKKSVTVKQLSRKNLPPVAIFETDKLEYEEDEEVLITNSSYDPNADDMTANWYIKNTDDADSSYKEFAKGNYIEGKGDKSWNPILKALGCDSDTDSCSYTIKLVVTDEYGKSDETTQIIKVNKSEMIEVGIKEVEIFTAAADRGLPVYMQLDENILIPNPDPENLIDVYDTIIHIKVNKNGEYYMSSAFKVRDLIQGVQFMILPTDLEVDKAYHFEFELASTDKSIIINPAAEKIALDARTAEEKIINTDDIDYTYKGLVSVKRSINTDQVNTYETIRVKTDELKPTVTGLGHSLDQTFNYELPTNQHYKDASKLVDLSSNVSFDEKLIDSYFNAVENVIDGKAIVKTEDTETVIITGAEKETITHTLSYPKVYVESITGHLFSQNQKLNNDSRIEHNLINGGHKLYIPIWLDQIGKYDIDYKTTEMGVNRIKFAVSQKLDIEGYLLLHMNSSTKNKDKFLIEPVNKKLPFLNGKPADWSDSDVEWIQN